MNEESRAHVPASAATTSNITIPLPGIGELCRILGYRPGERVSLNWQQRRPAGRFRSRIIDAADLPVAAATIPPPQSCVWFGVNPTTADKGRGTTDKVARCAALYAELDDKNTTHTQMAAILTDLIRLFGEPGAVVHSGHGVQLYWPIRDGAINDQFTHAAAADLLRRFGVVVDAAAAKHGAGKPDTVSELARVLRVPGSINHKDPDEPVPATLKVPKLSAAPMTVTQAADRLVAAEADLIPPSPRPSPSPLGMPPANADHPYVQASLDKELAELAACPEGGGRYGSRQKHLLRSAGKLAGWRCVDRGWLRIALESACHANGYTTDADQTVDDTIDRGFAWADLQPARTIPDNWSSLGNTTFDDNGDSITPLQGAKDQRQNMSGDPDDETIRTVPWPVLDDTALHGVVGAIVSDVAAHTEADPAALLVQLLAVFGAMVGRDPHIRVGNDEHPPILHPVIVGRTANGAKGTSTGVIKAIAKNVAPDFFTNNTASGLSSDAGLIERVSDPVMDIDKSGEPIVVNPGTLDKRLLVIETEYGSVLARGRRENNPLSQVIRQAWDADDLQTLNRKANSLTATRPHIVIIGHITPGEFRSTLRATDFSGGSVNRLLICMSRRSKLHTRLGNVPIDALQAAADKFGRALQSTKERGELKFTDRFWSRWDQVYPELVRDRPDSAAAAASSRAVPMVLRLAMMYTLMDGAEKIDAVHLEAALALWVYCEHSTRWLFSSYEQDEKRLAEDGLANFIIRGGRSGRTRTEISVDFYKRHKTAADISAELAPLIHDGIVIEEQCRDYGNRPVRRYIHRSLR